MLNRKRKPTGSPSIPGLVRLAKDVKEIINDARSVFLASYAQNEVVVVVIGFRISRGNRADRGQ
ncbi:hypothetical protein GN244_ATG02210 [Phytophthora infestans]|uniref:Uncharacterized protein n=1 Tax=Phytophthora infestans TaxID=4787 RepID=A0A833TF70_PHYIN|nr:hypothetical protein GN244_ATG02210 [Phytophthora infestans]KAF4130993.1 hypothetical protein GN958_ATG19812 [Phytophthora infestans]KAF4142081.1 hypothetical protein GN958_ATG08715 [Phytophthora infestans]